jgi:hypothetical protein
LLRFTTGAPSYGHSRKSIGLCPENIGEINMNKVYPSKTFMVVRVLEKDYDPFRPHQEGKEVLSFEYPYLSAIGTLMYLVNNTRLDIAFTVNLLTRFNAAPTIRHWNEVKKYL